MFVKMVIATDAQNGVARAGVAPWVTDPLASVAVEKHAQLLDRVTTTPPHLSASGRQVLLGEKKSTNAVVMGQRTWESLSTAPLPQRLNIVISDNPDFRDEGARSGLLVVSSPQEAYEVSQLRDVDTLWVVGDIDTIANGNVLEPLVSETFHVVFELDYKCDSFYVPRFGSVVQQDTLVGADPCNISAILRRQLPLARPPDESL